MGYDEVFYSKVVTRGPIAFWEVSLASVDTERDSQRLYLSCIWHEDGIMDEQDN